MVAQHKLVVADFHFQVQDRGNKQARFARMKWWKLEGEASKVFKEKVIEEGPWKDEGDANSMWEKMATCIRKVASDVLGVTKGVDATRKTLGGGIKMYKRLLRKMSAIITCIMTGVQTT